MLRCSFFIVLSLILLASCDSNTVHTEYKPVIEGSWDKEVIMGFTFSDIDTINRHNVFINVRNDNSFPYSNLILIAELNFPNGETIKDTLEYAMAQPDGTWLGKGNGTLKENKLWYKENIVFPTKGVYNLKLSHAMRDNGNIDGVIYLEGIIDIGFAIEKTIE